MSSSPPGPPLVSAVIATYNHERFVARAIDSVLAQEDCGGRVEVVVIDDGSTDGTPAVLAAYGDRIRVVRQDNAGHLGAFNRGLTEARGTYVALLDGDDEWLADKLRRQVALLEADPSLGLVYGDAVIVDADGATLHPSYQAYNNVRFHSGRAFGPLMAYNFVQTSTLVVRAALREHYDPIPSWGRAQDWWIALNVARHAAIAPVDGPVVRYRKHDANLSIGGDQTRFAQLAARELDLRRWAFAQARGLDVAVDDLVRAYHAFRRSVGIARDVLGRTEADLIPDRAEHAAAANALLARAVRARRAGDLKAAACDAAAVLCDLPRDAQALDVLDRCVRGLSGNGPVAEDRPAETRWPLEDARAFVTVAFADELARRPELLAAYAQAFGAGDDATLAVHLPDDAAVTALLGALEAAGVSTEDGPDLLAFQHPGDEALAAALARGAHAVLTAEPLPARYEARPGSDDPQRLRALAAERWAVEPLSVAIKICPPAWDGAERWGDTHFAGALADELRRRGHRPRLEVVHEWDSEAGAACDVALHLRGLWQHVPVPGQRSLLWVISHPELVGGAECDRYDHVFVASARDAERLAALTTTPVSVLEQATDPAVFFPDPDPAFAHDVTFVGNSRGILRPAIGHVLPTEHDLAVWGSLWEGLVDARHVRGTHLPNEQVRRAYSSAGVVLNDHWDDMREAGYASNRVYDALASGAVLLTDVVAGLEESFGAALTTYASREELRAHVDALLADPAARARIARRGRALVLAGHTFGHRVDALLDAAAVPAAAALAA
jgi:hypothetical protein